MPLIKITALNSDDEPFQAYINPQHVSGVTVKSKAYIYVLDTPAAYRLTLAEWQRIEPLFTGQPAPAETFEAAPVPQTAVNLLIEAGESWSVLQAMKAVSQARNAHPFLEPIRELNALYDALLDAQTLAAALPESVVKAWAKADIINMFADIESFDLATNDLFQALGRIIAPDRFPDDGDYAPRPVSAEAKHIAELLGEMDKARAAWMLLTDEGTADETQIMETAEAYLSAIGAIRDRLDQLEHQVSSTPIKPIFKTEGEN